MTSRKSDCLVHGNTQPTSDHQHHHHQCPGLNPLVSREAPPLHTPQHKRPRGRCQSGRGLWEFTQALLAAARGASPGETHFLVTPKNQYQLASPVNHRGMQCCATAHAPGYVQQPQGGRTRPPAPHLESLAPRPTFCALLCPTPPRGGMRQHRSGPTLQRQELRAESRPITGLS